MSAPHDVPDVHALLEAVRGFLAEELEPRLEGRERYHLKVAGNVLAIIERELRLGADHAVRHRERLTRLGFASDRELAAAIRSGAADERLAELEPELRAMVEDKLSVARPGYEERHQGPFPA